MARLASETAESRANIAERQRQREADPFSEREMLVADARFTKDNSDLVYTDPVASEDDEPELVYKTYDNSEPATAPQSIDADTVSRAIGIRHCRVAEGGERRVQIARKGNHRITRQGRCANDAFRRQSQERRHCRFAWSEVRCRVSRSIPPSTYTRCSPVCATICTRCIPGI